MTEIGNSAIAPPANGQTSTIDFEVVVSMDNPPSGIRPDLSATADIVTATRDNSLSIPIISLTLKSGEEVEDLSDGSNFQQNTSGPLLRSRNTDQEGVFIVSDGRVTFYPVQIGITGQEHFEVVSGLNVDDTIVVGPYQQIRDLEDNDLVVPISDEDEEKGFFGGRIRFQIGG